MSLTRGIRSLHASNQSTHNHSQLMLITHRKSTLQTREQNTETIPQGTANWDSEWNGSPAAPPEEPLGSKGHQVMNSRRCPWIFWQGPISEKVHLKIFPTFPDCPTMCQALAQALCWYSWRSYMSYKTSFLSLGRWWFSWVKGHRWIKRAQIQEERAGGQRRAVERHEQSNLTSACHLIRVEDVSLFTPADVWARGIDAEVGTVMLQNGAHVDGCKGR